MSTTIPGALKKNGTLHLRNCAAFYSVRPHTLRVWQRADAPLLDPDAMVIWKENRNRARLQKIGSKNTRHKDKRVEIVRLYVAERLGLRAISRYFGGRPSTAGVRAILLAASVYKGEDAMTEQAARSLARRKTVIATEIENRRRIATCLWRLRRGHPVETTCREYGWNPKSIWNALGRRASYRKLKVRLGRRWPDKRKYGRQYSRVFAREEQFQSQIEILFRSAAIDYVKECRLQQCRTRVDFKIADGTFVECKVGMNSGQTYEFIGQACHYRLFTHRVILCIPSDIELRADLYEVIAAQGVTVCNENTLVPALGGTIQSNVLPVLSPAKRTAFVCKCCGSNERRRFRANSYCVDCAPSIPTMRFDQYLDRWVPGAGDEHTNRAGLTQQTFWKEGKSKGQLSKLAAHPNCASNDTISEIPKLTPIPFAEPEDMR